MNTPTRTLATLARYAYLASLLRQRSARDLGLPPGSDPDPQMLARWAVHLRATLRPASWRQYRAALLASFELNMTQATAQAIEILRQADSTPCLRRPRSPRTSGQKLRRISPEDMSQIRAWLARHKSRWSALTIAWLQVGLITGLRPVEWQGARVIIVEGRPALLVENAKSTNGRAHGKFRTLHLQDLDLLHLDAIHVLLQVFRKLEREGLWERARRGCVKTLHRACRSLWPGRKRFPTLYSARHQFAADAKASGLTPAELAALMGHAVSDTVAEHYGRRAHGRGGFSMRADAEEVARIIDRPVTRTERRARHARAKRST